MKFRSLLLKNITRTNQKFTCNPGIAIGVATILGLGLVTNDLAESTQNALTADAADFSVVYGTTEGVVVREELLEGVVVLVVSNL
jgi:putative ABC transport system permease protein